MEPDKNQEQSAGDPKEQSAGDPKALANDSGAAQKEPTDATNYGTASSGGISPVVLILLVLIVIGVACKFLNPGASGLKPNEPEAKQRGAFAPYVQGSPSQPASP